MDEKRYNELRAEAQQRAKGYPVFNAVSPYYGADSGMEIGDTFAYINKQATYDNDWMLAKGFYNGLVANTGRGIMGALALIRDWNIDSLKERGLAYNENTVFEDIANSDVLTPYDIKGRNELEQLGIDFASGAGQLVGQAATTALTGGAGGMAAMGTQIAGNQYLNLRQRGVSAENARFPSIANALMQAPLERFGLEGILAKVPAKSVLREKAKRIAQAAITEGVTEWLQQYPEEITNLYALQPGDKDDPQQRRKAWFAAGDEFIKNFGDITREGAYAGLIGAMLGGGGAGINVMFGGVDRRIRKQVHNELLQDQAKRIEDVKKSGANPDYARNVINANTQGDKVYVDGGVLHQYMQQGNATEIAKNIGVPEAEVAKAAEEGLEVAINQGDFVAAAAKMPDFFQTVQNDVAFEEGGYTLTKAQLEEEQQKLAREIQREDPVFREQMDSIRMQMQKAGVNKNDIDKAILALESHARAAYPDEPSKLFIEHPLEIQRTIYRPDGQKYLQIKSASERLLEDERKFSKEIDDFSSGKNKNKTIRVMRTPIVMELVGARILPVDISLKNLNKILNKKHSDSIDADVIKQIPKALTDPLMIFDTYGGTNGEERKVVVLDLKDKSGATIVVPFELNVDNKDKSYKMNEVLSAYGKTDSKTHEASTRWIEEQLKSGKLRYINKKRAAAFDNEKLLSLMPYQNNGSSTNIIADEETLRKKRAEAGTFYQSAYHGTPYTFDMFDLGAIGTGEGNQAHGYGLYFAADKEIADNYRKILTGKYLFTYKDDNEITINKFTEEYQAIRDILTEYYENPKQGLKAAKESCIKQRKEELKTAPDYMVDVHNERIKALENIDVQDLHVNTGNTVEVDIPENDVLLNEEDSLNKQPLKVRKAILEYYKSRPDSYITDGMTEETLGEGTGEQFYKDVVFQMSREGAENPQRAASELLNSLGIKGITYNGGRDGRCFVVFDDKAISIINRYNQSVNTKQPGKNKKIPKGAYSINSEGRSVIELFQSADSSTIIHELGHYFVETLARDVNNGKATEQQQRDWEVLLNYAGITNEEWLIAGSDKRTAAHERFATGFEQYLMEGKAPSRETRSVFRHFKKWLLSIYKTIEEFIDTHEYAEPLTDDVRQVFGRMLAAEEDIQTAQRVDGYFNDLPAVVMDNLPESWQRRIDDFASKAKDKAVEILTQKSLANFTHERRERIEAYRTEILPQAQEDIEKMPLYNAADDIEKNIGYRKRTAKNIAQRYRSIEGKQYADWTDELRATRKSINKKLWPIIRKLKAGMDSSVEMRRANNEGRLIKESNSDLWYKLWLSENKREPTYKELREMAIKIYKGETDDIKGWDNNAAQIKEANAEKITELEDLLAHEEDLVNYKHDASRYRHKWLGFKAKESFDVIAEKYGYSCGDELAQKIIEAPSKQSAITARVDEYVQQAFPDIYKERELAADAVRESLYNDESGAVIGLEQQLIQDYIDEAQVKNRSAEANRRIALARKQQALVAAQTEINKMPVEDAVRTSRFIGAERLAAQRAAEAMALGAAEQKKAREAQNDGARSEAQANATAFFRQALRYKNQQAFNHAMVSESMKMRTTVTKYRNYINRQFTTNRKTWRTEQHFAQAAAILARMGFVRKDYDPYLKKQKLEQYSAEMEELYGTGSIAGWIMDENNSLRQPMQMTFKQFEDIVNALKNIKANAKAEEGKGTLGVNATFEELLYDIMQHLDKIETKFLPKAGKRLQATPVARMKASARTIDNLFEWMDGWSYGFFSKVFGGEIKHCNDREAELTMAWKERVVAAQKEWLPDAAAKREAERRFYSKELGCEVDRYVLVRLLMNLGNEGNARVLCSCPPNAMRGSELWVYPEGNKTYEQAVMETKANLLTYLGENLTIADVQYAQDMIDAANMYWNEFSTLEQRTKGFAPKKVEALPVDITLADGTEVTFKGGYFPLIRDGEFGNKPQSRDVIVSDTEPNQGRNIRTLATGNGNLKERVNASYPIDLTRGAEFYVMQNGIHDLCWRETLTGFRRILNDESMYAMLKEKLGPAQMKVFREMLEKAAQPFNAPGSSEGENLLNDAAGWLRRKTVAVAIMGNIKTMLQNGGNILLYGRSVEGFGYTDALAAMANWGKNWSSGDGEKGLRAFVTSKSVFMRERTENPDITLREIKDEDNLNPVEKKAMEWGSKAMAYTDNFTAMPVWAQAYMKKINDGAKEQEAVDFADIVIRRTLGSSRLTDVSSLQRGGNLAKLFMMFQGFFNTQYNQWERQYGLAKKKFKKGDYWGMAQNICAFACGKWFAVCLLNLLLAIENPFEDDDDEYMKVTKELMHYPISLLGPVGTVGNAVLDNAMGFSGYGYRMTAAESAINNVIRVAGKVNKVVTEDDAELTDLVEPAATVGGYIVGAPGVINKLFFNAWDILYNDMEPEWGDLLKRRPARER